MSSKKGAQKSMKVSLVVADGIDSLNNKDETIVDMTVLDDMKLSSVHQVVMKVLQLKEEDKFSYAPEGSKQSFEAENTFRELGISNGDRIYLETGRRKRKTYTTENHSNGGDEVLELICTTRIFDNDSSLSSPIRRVRVIVLADQLCRNLIDDVSSLWGRSGLKFKCGRTVLQGNKTFDEQGVENGAEIVVTGGRG